MVKGIEQACARNTLKSVYAVAACVGPARTYAVSGSARDANKPVSWEHFFINGIIWTIFVDKGHSWEDAFPRKIRGLHTSSRSFSTLLRLIRWAGKNPCSCCNQASNGSEQPAWAAHRRASHPDLNISINGKKTAILKINVQFTYQSAPSPSMLPLR